MTATETPVVLTDGTKIEWAHYTHNPWWGCSRVSRACRHCYAEALAKRYGHDVWGINAGRRTLSDANWDKPLKWNRLAARDGVRYRVFCASMADVFEDHEGLDEHRARLWTLIESTPHLDWMLLTKRPENIVGMLPRRWSVPVNRIPPNVWMGCTAEDQECADERLPHLLDVDGAVRFVSYEPAVGPLVFRPEHLARLHLVIAGGETGHGAQPAHPDWFRSVRDQCVAAGVAFFFKQWGDWAQVLDGATHRICWDGSWYPNEPTCVMSNEELVGKVGKKTAGRLLDGRTWDEMPKGCAA